MRSGLSIRSLPGGCERTDGQTAGKVPASVFRIFRERKGIVLAHLKETLDYYVRLRVAEIEGDMLTVLIGKNSEKLMQKYRLWVAANADLANLERELARK